MGFLTFSGFGFRARVLGLGFRGPGLRSLAHKVFYRVKARGVSFSSPGVHRCWTLQGLGTSENFGFHTLAYKT